MVEKFVRENNGIKERECTTTKKSREAGIILRKRKIFLGVAGMTAAALVCVDTKVVLADETDSYLPVFEEYRDAFFSYDGTNWDSIKTQFPDVSEFLVTNGRGIIPWYGFYDIDGNGTPELFWSYETIDGIEWKNVDVFSYDGEQIRKVGEDDTFSETTGSHVYENGIIQVNLNNQVFFYRIAPDGYSLENLEETLSADEFSQTVNGLENEIKIDWKKFDPSDWEEASFEEISMDSITGYPEYDEVIRKYYHGASLNWTIQEFSEDGLCYLFGYTPDINKIGYYVMDIDGDGTDELLIGLCGYEDSMGLYGYNNGMMYDLYTMINGERVQILSSGERDRYYLCQDNVIANEGSGGALSSSWDYYNLENGELEIKEAVFYDGYHDEENPWFYTTADPYENYSNPISEETARSLIAQYEYQNIPFISLATLTSEDVTSDNEETGLSELKQQAEQEIAEIEEEDTEIENELIDLSGVSPEQYKEKLNGRYELWDEELNVLWSYLKEKLSADEMDALTQDELSWINEKEGQVSSAASEEEGLELAAELTRERVYYLLDMLP